MDRCIRAFIARQHRLLHRCTKNKFLHIRHAHTHYDSHTQHKPLTPYAVIHHPTIAHVLCSALIPPPHAQPFRFPFRANPLHRRPVAKALPFVPACQPRLSIVFFSNSCHKSTNSQFHCFSAFRFHWSSYRFSASRFTSCPAAFARAPEATPSRERARPQATKLSPSAFRESSRKYSPRCKTSATCGAT